MKSLLATAAAAALAVGMTAAQAQDNSDSDDITDLNMEVDAEGGVTMDSFKSGFGDAGVFSEWDADADGMLSEDEFNAGVFGRYDADADGYWNADEFATMNNDAFWSGREKDGDGQSN